MKGFNLISSIVSTQWPSSYDLWEAWAIQLLVTMSLACQITLAVLGRRRRYMTSIIPKYVTLVAYLLSSYIVTVALSKLTVLQIDKPHQPDYITELKVLLAPLLLMQLGNPDSITAYSVEDNRLSVRQMLNLFIEALFVIWILIRCWDSSSRLPLLYLPLSVAGIIRSAVTVWALASVYWRRWSIEANDIFDEKTVGNFFNDSNMSIWSMQQTIILKAYYRFDCLKPHIANWLYQPKSLRESKLTVKQDLAFITTEVELGFMYDVLYTKQPVLYNLPGLICRFTSFSSLVSALCGFAIIYRSAFLINMYITYTYALLIGVTALEGYQIVLQPFSPWAIVAMSRHQGNRLMSTRLLHFLAERYMKRKRWSNSIGQLSLLDHRLYDEWPWWSLGKILEKHWPKKERIWRSFWVHSHPKIDSFLKQLLVENITKLHFSGGEKSFKERCDRTIEVHKLSSNVEWTRTPDALAVLKENISRTFDKSIIIWHVATKVQLLSEPDDSANCRGSELLSNYMIYLLALRPYTLSLTTTEITLEHACAILKLFLRYRDHNEALGTLLSEGNVLKPSPVPVGTIITRDWDVLQDARKLAVTLKGKGNKWQIICSIWVEMLCYAAYGCRVYSHTKLLRQGGELITHVWLLLMHHTIKYTHTSTTTDETKGKSDSEL